MAAVMSRHKYRCFTVLESGDGVHWRVVNDCSGPIQDRSSVFLNPLRTPRRWIYSIKGGPPPDKEGPFGRSRAYWESRELGVGADWTGARGGDTPFAGLPTTKAISPS